MWCCLCCCVCVCVARPCVSVLVLFYGCAFGMEPVCLCVIAAKCEVSVCDFFVTFAANVCNYLCSVLRPRVGHYNMILRLVAGVAIII